MAIFNTNRFDDTTEIIACEGYGIDNGGNYDAIMESYADDFAVVEAMHAFDMAEFELMKESSYDAEVGSPVLEASLKEIWQKIKTAFVNLGKRIMAFFKSVMDYINSLVMSGTDFANKYKERLSKLKLTGFTFDMYDYSKTPDTFKTGVAQIKAINKEVDGVCGKIAGVKINDANALPRLETMRNELAPKNKQVMDSARKGLAGTDNAEEFSKALYEKFRNGATKKRVSVTSLGEYVDKLANSKQLQDNIKEAKKTVDEAFKAIEKKINAAAADAESKVADGKWAANGAKQAALMRDQIKVFTSAQTLFTKYINAWSSAVSERTRTYKALCFKAMQHKNA